VSFVVGVRPYSQAEASRGIVAAEPAPDDQQAKFLRCLGQHTCVFRITPKCELQHRSFKLRRAKVSQSVFVVLIVTGLALTTYFGIAAWRASDDRDISDRTYLLE